MVKDIDGDAHGKVWEGPDRRSFHPGGAGVRHSPGLNVLTSLEVP